MKIGNCKQLGFLFLGLTLLFSGCLKSESNDYLEPAAGISFTDSDFNKETIGGNITVRRAEDENNVTSYVLYWGAGSAKISKIATLPKTGSNLKSKLPYKSVIPTGATHILAVSVNGNEESEQIRSVLIKDNFGIQYYENTPSSFNAVALDSLDNVYVAGSIYKSKDHDSITMKYTSQLEPNWDNFGIVSATAVPSKTQTMMESGEINAFALAIAVDENNGGVYTTGETKGNITTLLEGMANLKKELYTALDPYPEYQKRLNEYFDTYLDQGKHYGMEDIFWVRHNSEYGYMAGPEMKGSVEVGDCENKFDESTLKIQKIIAEVINTITATDFNEDDRLAGALAHISGFLLKQDTSCVDDPTNDRYTAHLTFPSANQFGTAGSDKGKAMVLSKDKLYITGILSLPNSSTDAFLAMYDIKDGKLYHQTLGDAQKNDYGNTVAVDSQGDIYIGGHTLGSLAGSSQGKMDSFIMKFSPKTMLSDADACTEDGKCGEIMDITHESNRLSPDDAIWKIQLGSSEQENDEVVAVDNLDNVYLAGNTAGQVCGKVAQEEGKIAIEEIEDVFIFKYSSEGAPLWCKQVGTVYKDLIQHMVVDSKNNVYLLIETKGSLFDDNQNEKGSTEIDSGYSDIAIIKYSPSGEEIWKKQFVTSGDDLPKSMALDSHGNIYIAGQTNRIFENENEQNEKKSAFIIKLKI